MSIALRNEEIHQLSRDVPPDFGGFGKKSQGSNILSDHFKKHAGEIKSFIDSRLAAVYRQLRDLSLSFV